MLRIDELLGENLDTEETVTAPNTKTTLDHWDSELIYWKIDKLLLIVENSNVAISNVQF